MVKVSEPLNSKLDNLFPEITQVLALQECKKLNGDCGKLAKVETTRPFWLDEVTNLPMLYTWIDPSHLTKI